jgi:hypothetical protein
MTTVDVYIQRAGTAIGGPGYLALHNGLFGPATTALRALIRAYEDGTLTGTWNSSHIEATVPGTVVRSVLAAVDPQDVGFRGDHDRERFTAFCEAVEDGAAYSVKAIEV